MPEFRRYGGDLESVEWGAQSVVYGGWRTAV